jgi:hypothetical protein
MEFVEKQTVYHYKMSQLEKLILAGVIAKILDFWRTQFHFRRGLGESKRGKDDGRNRFDEECNLHRKRWKNPRGSSACSWLR